VACALPNAEHQACTRDQIVHRRTRDFIRPFGAKGVGKISGIPITPAMTNAIYNAVGVRVRRWPVDQDLLLRAMKSGAKHVD